MEIHEPPKEIWERKKLGIELRQKYELYFVTLIFTLTGLSIQTARPYAAPFFVWVEIVAWGSLLLAGLLGLWRVSRLWLREFRVGEYFEAQFDNDDRHVRLRQELNTLDDRLGFFNKLQWPLFVVGLMVLAVARASTLFTTT